MKIVSPSKGRYDNFITKEAISDVIIVCSETEEDLYRDHNPDCEVIATPKEIKGIVKTRQWILDKFDDVFMVDDDMVYMRRVFSEMDEPYKISDPEHARAIIEQLGDLAKQMGAKMFGFINRIRPEHYDAHNPFRFTGYMNASYCGYLKGHGLKYDTKMIEGEDHYMSCLNVYKNRYGLIDKRYSFYTKDNFKAEGGCCDYRTLDHMKETTLYLRETFGEVIQLKKPTTAKKEINEGERSLKFPF